MSKEKITEEISQSLKKHGFLPIPVQTISGVETSRYFAGNFEEFVEAAKALGTKGIFIETLYLEDDEFYYDSGLEGEDECGCGCKCSCCDCGCDCDCDEDCDCGCQDDECTCEDSDDVTCSCEAEVAEDEEEDSEEDAVWLDPEDFDGVDLALIRPEIDKFEEKIGEECGVRLTIPGVDHVEVEIFTEWYDKFATLVDEASEMIELDTTAAVQEIQKNLPKED